MLLEIKPLTSVFMELKNKIQNVPGDIFLTMNSMSVAYFSSHMMIENETAETISYFNDHF